MDTALGLFPVGPEEKEAESIKTASLTHCLLQDATRYSAHLLPLRVTQDQDKVSLPHSQSPAVLQSSRVATNFAF